MKSKRQLGTIGLVSLGCWACLGCGSRHDRAFTSDGSGATAETAPSGPAAVVPTAQGPASQGQKSELPVAKPTSEQLARWKVAAFDPLVLLAYRDHPETGFVSFIAATNDAKQYLLGGTRLTLWDISREEPVHEFIGPQTEDDKRLLSFAVSPVADWCAVGDAGGILRTFDIAGRKELVSRETDTHDIVGLAISPDGKEIATSPFVSEITVWNADTLEKKGTIDVDAREVKHLEYIGPNVLIAAGETMSTWDTASGKKLKTYPSGKYQTAVALAPNRQELVFGAAESLQRWNLTEDVACGEYRGVPYRNPLIRFTSDEKLVAVVTGEKIRILDATTGQILQVIDAAGSTVTDASWIPRTHLLLVGTDTGRIRIWGRPDEGKVFGLTPLQTPIAVTRHDSGEPAVVAENLALVDVRSLPRLPDAKPQSDSFSSDSYAAPVGREEAAAFFRYILEERGWQVVADQVTPYTVPYRRDGYLLNLSLYGEKPTETLISLSCLGNYDLRKTPRLDDSLKEVVYEGDTSVIYKVSASLLQIETQLLSKLHQAGWTAVVRLGRSQNEQLDTRDFEFVRNGTVLRVNVQRDREKEGLFVVSYGLSLTLHSLPVPPDAGLMEWDDYLESRMVANTSMSLQEATAFYESAMKKHGWTLRESGRHIEQKVVYLPYFWGQRDVTIALEEMADGRIRILAGKYAKDSWQNPEEPDASADGPEAESGKDDGIEAADVPILHAVGSPTYTAEKSMIEFEIEKVPLLDVSKAYSEAMMERGWTVKPFGEPLHDSISLHFEKGSKIVYFQSSIDPRGIGSVNLSGNGLRWTKDIASQQLVSYSAWLRNHKFPATLKRLDEYQRQMEKH